jgi:hypothetical protein
MDDVTQDSPTTVLTGHPLEIDEVPETGLIGLASDPTHRDHGGVAPQWVHVQIPDAPDVSMN